MTLSCLSENLLLMARAISISGLVCKMPTKRKAWILRKEKIPARGKTWPIIASNVGNLAGRVPYWKVCRDAYTEVDTRHIVKDAYNVDEGCREVDRASHAQVASVDGRHFHRLRGGAGQMELPPDAM